MGKAFLEKCDDMFARIVVYVFRDFVAAYWKHIFTVFLVAAAYGIYMALPAVCRMI